ncbi:MAG: PBP1A family penicillin-binding protein [Acidobacteriota bacterium]
MRLQLTVRVAKFWRRRWVRVAAIVVGVPAFFAAVSCVYYYVTFSRLIDARLHGERDRVLPRVFARPLELRRGQSMTERQLVDRLNDLGYTLRAHADNPGEFAMATSLISIMPRAPELKGRLVRVVFPKPPPPPKTAAARARPPRVPDRVERLEVGGEAGDQVTLEMPVLTALNSGEREKRRDVALPVIPPRVVQAVLAIEDRRFYAHPGVDPIGVVGAVFSYLTGRRTYLAGGSTITQQLVRNVFLPRFEGMTLQAARARSMRRKVLEVFVSVVLTSRASKDEILELYLNNIPLGQRGSFAIAGVPEAARLFFGKDVSNLSIAEAATIAGVIQSPSALSPFNNPARCTDRRNVVLQAMADEAYITPDEAQHAAREPLAVVQRALEAEAPNFVDFVGQTLAESYPGLTTTTNQAVDVHTTLDLHLQRLAQDAVRDGLLKVDQLLSRRKRRGKAEAALIAVDPKTGEILALVGGRSYNQSQYNRVIASRRQPGSVFKPFVFLTAFEQAAATDHTDITPATIVIDEPETFEFDDQVWTPENYEKTYDGPITYRHALAHSRNLATIHVAQTAGYGRVAALWKRIGVGTVPRAYPSIALGVFEATPYEIASAYTLFPNQGVMRPLQHILSITRGGRNVTKKATVQPRRIARAETSFLVTDMMRSVLNGGTGAGARSAGFTLNAAGKTGTTNDLRDAWFVGFTPDLLTVVWVGFDDNQPVGLTGAQAALPIWAQFMARALAGRSSVGFEVPEGVVFEDIDADTGKLATPACPRVFHEAFLAGTAPTGVCELHTP